MNKKRGEYQSVQVAENPTRTKVNPRTFSGIYEHAPCGLITLTPAASISAINSRGMELIGAPGEIHTQTTFIDFIDTDYHGAMVQALQNTVTTGKPQTAELKMARRRNHCAQWLRADVCAHVEANGQLKQWQLSLVDITETDQRCRRLENELEKKNLLMRELNHRIANNLMMISSLIMQKEAEDGRNDDLDEIRYQIEAIRYVHEFLNRSEGYREIDMAGYLKELLSTIFSYFTDQAIEIVNKVDNIKLPTQTAIYIGIIVNEVASNAIKYGFNHEKKPRFTVCFNQTEDQRHYRLELSNSGNPFPEDISVSQSDSLGLSLITSLTEELDGEVELQRYPAPVFTIRFPKENV
ncbi:MAG: sensor histidine kinase [Spirochaetota bacterium]